MDTLPSSVVAWARGYQSLARLERNVRPELRFGFNTRLTSQALSWPDGQHRLQSMTRGTAIWFRYSSVHGTSTVGQEPNALRRHLRELAGDLPKLKHPASETGLGRAGNPGKPDRPSGRDRWLWRSPGALRG
jgi:hypothetical protein